MTTDLLKPFIDKPLIKVITGIRRSGKAFILKLLKEELIEKGVEEHQIFYLNLESLEFSDIDRAEKLYILKSGLMMITWICFDHHFLNPNNCLSPDFFECPFLSFNFQVVRILTAIPVLARCDQFILPIKNLNPKFFLSGRSGKPEYLSIRSHRSDYSWKI